MSFSSNLWLVGSGQMAQEYASVLESQGVDFHVIGRGLSSAREFEQVTSIPVITGGLDAAYESLPVPNRAIISVGVEQLSSVASQLIVSGCKHLLLEKPGALYLTDLQRLSLLASRYGSRVWIAYNRRYYSSVQKLRELVIIDGGITSIVFEFTEWSHTIAPLIKAPGVRALAISQL